MYVAKVGLFGIETTIDRPVQIIVSNDIKNMLDIDAKVYIQFDSKDNIIKSKNGLGNIQGNNTILEDYITVEAVESNDEGYDMALTTVNPDGHPIYTDMDVGSTILSIYQRRKVTISFRYSNKSKAKIYSIMNRLKLATAVDGMYRRHNLEYSYTIPRYVLELISNINTLKNLRLPTPVDLDVYVNNTFDNRVDFTNTLDADTNKTDVVIREKQTEVQGFIIDDLQTLQPEYDDTLSMHTIGFSYEIVYEKPVGLYLKYPILIYNNLIDKMFRQFIPTNTRNIGSVRTAGSQGLMDLTTRYSSFGIRNDSYYLTVPAVDTVIKSPPPPSHVRLMSVLTMVDPLNPTVLFNLADIPTVGFVPSVVTFLTTSEYPYIGSIWKSMFYIQLYKDGAPDYKNSVLMDNLGNLTTALPMSVMSTYRVMFNVLADLNSLVPASITRTKAYINLEVANSATIKPTLDVFGVNRLKDTIRPPYTSGTEMYIDQDGIADIYLSLLSVKDENIVAAAAYANTAADLLFHVKITPSIKFMTKEVYLTIAAAMSMKPTT